MSVLPFHEAAALFPLLHGRDYEDLKADIHVNGQREPVWTYQGKIIDGRNRARACEDLDLAPRTREWDGDGSLVAFIVSLNLHRRHLTSSQRAAVAAEMLPMLEREAKERQRTHGKTAPGRKATLGQKVDGVKDGGKAAQQAAKLAGTNRQYVADAKRIREQAPDLHEQVKAGKLKVTQAKHQLKERDRRAAERVVAEQRAKDAPQLSLSRWNEMHAEVRSRPEFVAAAEKVKQLQAHGRERLAEVLARMKQLEEEYRELENQHNAYSRGPRPAEFTLEFAVAKEVGRSYCTNCGAKRETPGQAECGVCGRVGPPTVIGESIIVGYGA